MASKPVNPEDPGQAQVYLNDFLLARRSLTDFQAMTLLEAISYEWETGHEPYDLTMWTRMARPINGRQKAELAELMDIYAQHPLVLKMRARRTERIIERQNRSLGAQEREQIKQEVGTTENTEVRTPENSMVRSQTSEDVKSLEINESASELSDNSYPSSTSPSSSTSLISKSSNEDSETKPPAKRRKRTGQPTDERLQHWGIQAIRSLTGYWPRKILWDEIIETLGAEPQVDRLTECFRAWAKVSNNAGNSTWYLDWFANGLPQNQNGWRAGPQRQSVADTNAANAAIALQRTLERMGND